MTYKMKGSPMQRNFGIDSPVKNEKKIKEVKSPSIFGKSPKEFAFADIKRIKKLVKKAYSKISGSKTKVKKDN